MKRDNKQFPNYRCKTRNNTNSIGLHEMKLTIGENEWNLTRVKIRKWWKKCSVYTYLCCRFAGVDHFQCTLSDPLQWNTICLGFILLGIILFIRSNRINCLLYSNVQSIFFMIIFAQSNKSPTVQVNSSKSTFVVNMPKQTTHKN